VALSLCIAVFVTEAAGRQDSQVNASTLAAALESALNFYLGQDPDSARRAAGLRGKVIAINLTGTPLTLYFLPDADGVQVLSHFEGDVDTRLSGSPLGFARLALDSREDALFQGAVKIDGDTATGQEFQELLAAANWDWEEQLSHITGDVIAHQIGRLAAQLGQTFRDSRETLASDCGEYLQEEAQLLPTRSEVQYFLNDTDHLRDNVERLEARVKRLLQAMEQAP
jgi:ubiquinone biosynthesis accessory factor UbiJ